MNSGGGAMQVFQQFIQQVINGLALGSMYALIALGYTMVYGIIKLINFAHGDILMVGAYVAYLILAVMGVTPLSLTIALILSMAVCAIMGVVIEKLAYKPLRNSPRITVLITAIGVSLLLENGFRTLPFVGPNVRPFPQPANKMFVLGGINISSILIIELIVSIVLMGILTYVVNYTKIGKAMRAVSHDTGAAQLMGINVNNIISFTFAIGSALAAAAGMLFAIVYPQIEPYMGIMPGLKAFIAAVVGGIGNVPGAMIGGFIIAIAETLTKGFISSKLADAIVFGLLILVLVVKPSGIMGKNSIEKV
jgi:branched-chain amino acid transport system permease protein